VARQTTVHQPQEPPIATRRIKALPQPAPTPTTAPTLRRETLRDGLSEVMSHLKNRRADLIDEGFIADYVALDWLEWHGGTLRATEVGDNICRQLAHRQPPRDR
jgi:hypothetical protein